MNKNSINHLAVSRIRPATFKESNEQRELAEGPQTCALRDR